mmetsp:Transcript_71702/g.134096  ORF Transcript_71702/g.134096 Transcript_71702/m.134096 type:complete len:203 (-) Transcript_71702:212-820(-)
MQGPSWRSVQLDVESSDSGGQFEDTASSCAAGSGSPQRQSSGLLTQSEWYHASKQSIRSLADSVQRHGYTTLMLQELPTNVSQNTLLQMVRESGFHLQFDYLHLPSDANDSTKSLGYAFINFLRPYDAARFMDMWADTFPFGANMLVKFRIATRQGYKAYVNPRALEKLASRGQHTFPYIASSGVEALEGSWSTFGWQGPNA